MKASIPKITPPAVVEIYEVRYECSDDSYAGVMEDCVNKNLDVTHIYVYEYDIENNVDAIKMVIEKFPDGHDDGEK